MKILPILGAVVALIAGQDPKTVVFPPNGNDSFSEAGNKVEHQPDMTRGGVAAVIPAALVPPPPPPPPPPLPPPMMSSDYFFPVPPRAFLHHRSENVPYGYEYPPNVAYPMAHSIEHSVVPTSKQLVIVSFIGLLLLLAIIQNTLSAVKRKDAIMDLLSSRQKRDVHVAHDFRPVTPEEEEILNSDARVRCIQRTICHENRKLFRDLGAPGKMLAKYLTRDIEKSLRPSSSGWDRLVRDAGAAGIRGENCDVLYRACDTPVVIRNMRAAPNNVLTSTNHRDLN